MRVFGIDCGTEFTGAIGYQIYELKHPSSSVRMGEALSFPIYTNMDLKLQKRLHLYGTPDTLVVENGLVVKDWMGAYSPEVAKDIGAYLGVTLPGKLATPAPNTDKAGL